MKAKDAKVTMTKIVINDKLFEIFNDENPMCVKDLYCGKHDDIYKKYDDICHQANDNCSECWKQFIIEDLIKMDEQKITPQICKIGEIEPCKCLVREKEDICGCEGSCPICRIGEVSDHQCNNINCGARFCTECHGIIYAMKPGWANVNSVSVCHCRRG